MKYVNSIQTEIGQLDIIYLNENGSTRVELWLNNVNIRMPPEVLKQTSKTIVRKVVQAYKSAKIGA